MGFTRFRSREMASQAKGTVPAKKQHKGMGVQRERKWRPMDSKTETETKGGGRQKVFQFLGCKITVVNRLFKKEFFESIIFQCYNLISPSISSCLVDYSPHITKRQFSRLPLDAHHDYKYCEGKVSLPLILSVPRVFYRACTL